MYDIVTGSHGFCGSHLSEYLIKRGDMVIELHHEALVNPQKVNKFLSAYQPFRLYHLASYGNMRGQDDVFEIYNANVGKLLTILEATKDLECRGIVIAGSTSEYGIKKLPMKEDQLLVPQTFYAAAKASATLLAQTWVTQYGTPIVIYRPSSVTGVGEQSVHLIPTLIRSCFKKEPIEFIGSPAHDYVDVTDVVKAVSFLGRYADKYKGQIFNVSSCIQYTNQDVLDTIELMTGRKANIKKEMELKKEDASTYWTVDNAKMRAIGWEPSMTLMDSLEGMVDAYAH